MIYSILCKQCVTENCRHRGVWPANERCGCYSPNAHFKPISEANAVARMERDRADPWAEARAEAFRTDLKSSPDIRKRLQYGDWYKPIFDASGKFIPGETAPLKNCESCRYYDGEYCNFEETDAENRAVLRWVFNNTDIDTYCPGWKGKE